MCFLNSPSTPSKGRQSHLMPHPYHLAAQKLEWTFRLPLAPRRFLRVKGGQQERNSRTAADTYRVQSKKKQPWAPLRMFKRLGKWCCFLLSARLRVRNIPSEVFKFEMRQSADFLFEAGLVIPKITIPWSWLCYRFLPPCFTNENEVKPKCFTNFCESMACSINESVPTFPALALAVVRTSWSITGLPTGLCTSTWPPFCWRAETNRNTETSGFWRRKDINKVLCTFWGEVWNLHLWKQAGAPNSSLHWHSSCWTNHQSSELQIPPEKKSEDLFIWFFCAFFIGEKNTRNTPATVLVSTFWGFSHFEGHFIGVTQPRRERWECRVSRLYFQCRWNLSVFKPWKNNLQKLTVQLHVQPARNHQHGFVDIDFRN